MLLKFLNSVQSLQNLKKQEANIFLGIFYDCPWQAWAFCCCYWYWLCIVCMGGEGGRDVGLGGWWLERSTPGCRIWMEISMQLLHNNAGDDKRKKSWSGLLSRRFWISYFLRIISSRKLSVRDKIKTILLSSFVSFCFYISQFLTKILPPPPHTQFSPSYLFPLYPPSPPSLPGATQT